MQGTWSAAGRQMRLAGIWMLVDKFVKRMWGIPLLQGTVESGIWLLLSDMILRADVMHGHEKQMFQSSVVAVLVLISEARFPRLTSCRRRKSIQCLELKQEDLSVLQVLIGYWWWGQSLWQLTSAHVLHCGMSPPLPLLTSLVVM